MAKQKQNNTVEKAFTPEEAAMIENLSATINELKQLSMASGVSGDEGLEDVEMEADGNSEKIDKIMKILKGEDALDEEDEEIQIAEKSEEARENADQRAEPTTDLNDKNLSSVSKSLDAVVSRLDGILNKNQPVKKSADPQVADAISKIANIVSNNATDMMVIKNALGISDIIEKQMAVTKSNDTSVPVQTSDRLEDVLKQLSDSIKGNNHRVENLGDEKQTELQKSRKDMAAALPHIFRNAMSNK